MSKNISYRIYNIQYDEGYSDLPSELFLELEEGLTDEELDHEASEFISNETGFCHKGFELSTVN